MVCHFLCQSCNNNPIASPSGLNIQRKERRYATLARPPNLTIVVLIARPGEGRSSTCRRCMNNTILHIHTGRTDGTARIGTDVESVAHLFVVGESGLGPTFHLHGTHDFEAVAVVAGLGFVGDDTGGARAACRRPQFVGRVALIVRGVEVAGRVEESR